MWILMLPCVQPIKGQVLARLLHAACVERAEFAWCVVQRQMQLVPGRVGVVGMLLMLVLRRRFPACCGALRNRESSKNIVSWLLVLPLGQLVGLLAWLRVSLTQMHQIRNVWCLLLLG